LSSSNLDFVFT